MNNLFKRAARSVLSRTGFELRRKEIADFQCRAWTDDANIFHAVVVENEYRLPDRFSPSDLIIDIGAHIGAFSFAALSRGAGRVLAYEAHPDNYRLAKANLGRFGGRVGLSERAVWRSDLPDRTLPLGHCDAEHMGVPSLMLSDGVSVNVESVSLDELMPERVRLLKLDCEGSEYPILFTSRRLRAVDEIRGEYHELRDDEIPEHARLDGARPFNREGLKSFLESKGFKVELRPYRPTLGLFFARR